MVVDKHVLAGGCRFVLIKVSSCAPSSSVSAVKMPCPSHSPPLSITVSAFFYIVSTALHLDPANSLASHSRILSSVGSNPLQSHSTRGSNSAASKSVSSQVGAISPPMLIERDFASCWNLATAAARMCGSIAPLMIFVEMSSSTTPAFEYYARLRGVYDWRQLPHLDPIYVGLKTR